MYIIRSVDETDSNKYNFEVCFDGEQYKENNLSDSYPLF